MQTVDYRNFKNKSLNPHSIACSISNIKKWPNVKY